MRSSDASVEDSPSIGIEFDKDVSVKSKIYRRPSLTDYGQIRDETLGGSPGGGDSTGDGGTENP